MDFLNDVKAPLLGGGASNSKYFFEVSPWKLVGEAVSSMPVTIPLNDYTGIYYVVNGTSLSVQGTGGSYVTLTSWMNQSYNYTAGQPISTIVEKKVFTGILVIRNGVQNSKDGYVYLYKDENALEYSTAFATIDQTASATYIWNTMGYTTRVWKMQE